MAHTNTLYEHRKPIKIDYMWWLINLKFIDMCKHKRLFTDTLIDYDQVENYFDWSVEFWVE